MRAGTPRPGRRAPGAARGAHAPLTRLSGWLFSYLLVVNLILGGLSAGAMAGAAATGIADAAGLCSLHLDDGPDQGGEAPAGHPPHCLLCPLGGATPLLPEPVHADAPRAACVPAAPQPCLQIDPPAPPRHESARPRAPPVPA
ncbi:hypothetical protein EDC64_10941 [Aquabacter spiritensis]|uniref:DUF2946 family protein n=1 Tax=Aquabacter spiritensis TaxID=933073 RepID=A0A4R3LSY9_9HYPH|nr:hypothetical protein EDC64_10941 [Aquabacter spiritensis]